MKRNRGVRQRAYRQNGSPFYPEQRHYQQGRGDESRTGGPFTSIDITPWYDNGDILYDEKWGPLSPHSTPSPVEWDDPTGDSVAIRLGAAQILAERVAEWKRENPRPLRRDGVPKRNVQQDRHKFRKPPPQGEYEIVKNVPHDKPNPGSRDAQKIGCTCNDVTNNHGIWAPFPPDEWWVSSSCPVHNPTKEKR